MSSPRKRKVLTYIIRGTGYLGLWCMYCRRVHLHGGSSRKDGGHRVAHCQNLDSPFRKGGYHLDVCGEVNRAQDIGTSRTFPLRRKLNSAVAS